MPMEGSSMSRYLEVIALVREREGSRQMAGSKKSAVCTRKDFSFFKLNNVVKSSRSFAFLFWH